MCGLIGIASSKPHIAESWLAKAADSMFHRGPDDAGTWWSRNKAVGLAHRRLSIVELSEKGHQPMHLQELGLSIVFNGEIYNHIILRQELIVLGHTFRSESDTEVLLAAYAEWGAECLVRLNGMFAFAIYDSQKEHLFVARDRSGEKPLFYSLRENTFYFASELKALLVGNQSSPKISSASMDCYLSMGFVPGDRCILEDFKKLPAAHALQFDICRGELNVWRYWAPPEYKQEDTHTTQSEHCLLEELESLLEDSVRLQLIADVPVGVLLSGGVDSSLITAMAVRQSNRVHTFSIRFPGHGELDETQHARLIAQYFNTEHVELEAADVTTDLVRTLSKQFDEPIVDSSMIPTFLVSQLVRQHCKVALGGDGGDELFGGYEHYSRLLWMKEKLSWAPFSIRRTIAESAGYIMPVGVRGRNWLQSLAIDLDRGLPQIANYFDVVSRRKLLAGFIGHDYVAEEIRSSRLPSQSNLLQRATRMDFTDYLAEDILVKVDRASMLNSLEIRAPFLDYRLIEFAYGKVPPSLKSTSSQKKILLKHLASKLLPPEFDLQRKQGFSIPLAHWLRRGPFRELFWSVLTDPSCIFDRKAVHSLLHGQDLGRSNSERLFSLVMFELWRREYKVTL